MIKFRYKRKEPAIHGGTSNGESSPTTKIANKSIEPKSSDAKNIDKVSGSLKTDTNDTVHNYSSTVDQSNLVVQARTCSEQEYMEDCIRAIVVSFFSVGFFFQVVFFSGSPNLSSRVFSPDIRF